MHDLDAFREHGWMHFAFDPALASWAAHARPPAEAAAQDPAQSHWLRCGGTWFVGVDALPNDDHGRLTDGPALSGAAWDFVCHGLKLALPLHQAQVSVCYPGYPQPSGEETPAATNYRVKRDSAHVDGLLAEGPERRRFLREPHAYILGIALSEASVDAAPLVVWQASHLIMHKCFEAVFAGIPPENWPEIDVTEAYQVARRKVFASCRRIELPQMPGEAVLLHRHMLHGVAPWGAKATVEPVGRMIAYFRPEFHSFADWLVAP